jgi:hypothetical protein
MSYNEANKAYIELDMAKASLEHGAMSLDNILAWYVWTDDQITEIKNYAKGLK